MKYFSKEDYVKIKDIEREEGERLLKAKWIVKKGDEFELTRNGSVERANLR